MDSVDKANKIIADFPGDSQVMIPVKLLEDLIFMADAYIGATELIEPYVLRSFELDPQGNRFLPASVQDSISFLLHHREQNQ